MYNKKFWKQFLIALALFLAGWFTFGHAQAQGKPEKTKVTIAVGGKNLFYYLPLTIAERQGYFKDEGLDYVFQELVQSTDGKVHDKGDRVGAMQSFEEGRKSDVSCACHWTVNVAAAKGHGRLNRDVYSVAPSGIFNRKSVV